MICSIFKKRRRVNGVVQESRDWFATLRMPWEDGCPRVWSLRTADKREAERLLHEARFKAEKRHNGLLPPEEHEEARKRPLNELLEAFLGHLHSIGRAPSTLKKYRELRLLFARCGWTRLDHVAQRTFCEWRARSDLSGETLNDQLKNACNFFHWLQRTKQVSENPLQYVEPVKVTPSQFRRAINPEQAQRLLAVASPRRAVVYLTALQTGLRRKELQLLTVGDFVLDAPKPFVRVPASIAKNRKETTLWLREEVAAAVRSILPDGAMPFEKVFAGMVPRLPRFKRDLALAGIPFEDETGRRFDFHALRVTFGTNLSVAGVSPRVAMEMMRHSDIKLTMRIYTDVAQLPTAAAVASLPALTVPDTQNDTKKHTKPGVAADLRESLPVAEVAS